MRAADDGCVDHSCVGCVTWRGAVDLSLVRKYLALTRGAAVVGGGLSLSGAALSRAVRFPDPRYTRCTGYFVVGRWTFPWQKLKPLLDDIDGEVRGCVEQGAFYADLKD